LLDNLDTWNCAPLALFFALKSTVVSKERLKSIKTFFNSIAQELDRIDVDIDDIGFEEIVTAANQSRKKRKALV